MHNTQQQERKEAIYLALAQIPEGKVITYGNLAKLAGMPNGARLVGKLLSALPENTELPWHRVINAQGKISLSHQATSHQEQIKRLSAEGVVVVNGRIQLKNFGG
jgi:methylated-DNA-protein-cysteine methyltransferase related protein